MYDMIGLKDVKVLEVFSDGGVDELLKKITKEAKSIIPNVETAKGRADVATVAHRVAKSKTYLDALGKDLVSDWKQKAKVVDNERKKMRDYLDELKAEVRQPLTDWENAEVVRVEGHEQNIIGMTEGGLHCLNNWMELDVDVMEGYLRNTEAMKIGDNWEEFANRAAVAKDEAIANIKQAIEKRQKYDAEQAELEKLRIEAAEHEKEKHEEALRKEGEEKAKREADAKAKEESERAEKERQAAVQAKEDAERRAKEAEDNVARDAERAAQAERDRIESERVAEELAAKKREADKAHRAKINNAAMDALVTAGTGKLSAKTAVTAIAKGQIPHIAISY